MFMSNILYSVMSPHYTGNTCPCYWKRAGSIPELITEFYKDKRTDNVVGNPGGVQGVWNLELGT